MSESEKTGDDISQFGCSVYARGRPTETESGTKDGNESGFEAQQPCSTFFHNPTAVSFGSGDYDLSGRSRAILKEYFADTHSTVFSPVRQPTVAFREPQLYHLHRVKL